jgi:hypothetical protein
MITQRPSHAWGAGARRYTVLKMLIRWVGVGRHAEVLLLLCLVLVAQSSVFASATRPHHSEDHCCLLRHLGPLPFLNTNVPSVVCRYSA